MLDTNDRRYIDPIMDRIAKAVVKTQISANSITLLAFIIGLLGAVTLYFGQCVLSIILLWISGFFDVLDGSVARLKNEESPIGAQFDIISDRVVELSYFWALALTNRDSILAIMFLITTAFLSMTVFLTTGIISKNDTKKSFYYQAGLMERTEGFIATTIMIVFNAHLTLLTYIYGGLILFTAIQRILETLRINKE